jgi:protein-disulfide isomerase
MGKGLFPVLLLAALGCEPAVEEMAESTPEERAAAGVAVTSDILGAKEQLVQEPERVDVSELGFDLGDPDAPVKIIEFSDYACGYCRKFHVETLPNLTADYIETGKVSWKYIPFELGMFQNGREGALAGQCAAQQDEFFAMSDMLFERQSEWKNSSDPNPTFVGFAEELGLDGEAYSTCLGSVTALAVIRGNTQVARGLGIRGTPTFFVNGFPLQGALPENVFRDMLDGVLSDMAEQGGGA